MIDTNDNRYDIATVLPVAQGSQEVSSAAIARGGQAKKERQRQEMEQFVPRVKEVLGTNIKNLSHISTEIKRIPGFQQAFERAFGKHIGIKQFFDLFFSNHQVKLLNLSLLRDAYIALQALQAAR